MLNPWLEQSEKSLGLILRGDQSPLSYSPDNFFSPEQQAIVKYIQDNPDYTREDLYTRFPSQILDSANHAVLNINGSGKEVNWADILRKTKNIYEIGDELEKTGKQAKRSGELPEILSLRGKLDSFVRGETSGVMCSLDVDWKNAKGLQKSGWDALDLTIGGIAESGPVVVFAATKTGKSFWCFKLLSEFLNYYPKKKAIVFTLEMPSDRQLNRSFQVYPKLMKSHEEGRLFITHKTRRASEISNAISTNECDIAVIDGIDGMIKGERSASAFAQAWAEIIEIGVVLEIPIIVTAQPNRGGKFWAGTQFLDKYWIEWSGAAENGAEQLIALQHIKYAIDFEDNRFPVFDDTYYMISWLQREDWKGVPVKGPGAIIFKPEDAEYYIDEYGDKQRVPWGGKAHGREIDGKKIPSLWREQPKGTKIAQSSRRKREED